MAVGVRDSEAPARVLRVSEARLVPLRVPLAEPVPLLDGVPVELPVPLRVPLEEAVPLAEPVPLLDGVPVELRVPVCDGVALPDIVLAQLGVSVDAAFGEGIAECAGEVRRRLAMLRPRKVMDDTATSASPRSHSVDS